MIDTLFPVNSSHPVNKGAVAWWLPLRAGGGKLYDIVGNSHGTLQADATWATMLGSKFPALTFDGVGDFVIALNDEVLTAYTISAWVVPTDVTSTSILLLTNASGPSGVWTHQLRIDSGSKFVHYTFDGSTNTLAGSTTVVSGEKYHVVGVARNDGTMRLYVNGVEEGTPISLGSPLYALGDRYYIGSNSGDGMGYYSGVIGPVRLFRRVLSASEIRVLYQDGLRDYPNLLNRRPITYFIPAAATPAGTFFPYF